MIFWQISYQMDRQTGGRKERQADRQKHRGFPKVDSDFIH